MDILIISGAMIVVGAAIGALAGRIWKDERPFGLWGDIGIAVVTTIAVGLIGWIVIPAMGFSQQLALLSVALEPALSALLVLWLIRRSRR